jgi:hypothetical protein
MAKKTAGRLAGLAALAAAAYMASKGKGEAKAGGKEALDSTDTAEAKESAAIRSDIANQKMRDADTGDFMSRRLNRVDTDDGLAYSTNNLSPMSSPAKVARSEKAPSAPATKAPAIGGPTPTRAPGGVGKRGGVSVGTGSGGGRGAAAGEEAAYRDTGDAMSRRMSAIPADTSDAVSRRKNVEETATSSPVDETKLSANERTKRQIEKNLAGARSGSSATDTRSANERMREAIGMKKGGAVKKMASGGMTSQRGDGIASKGKTRCKMY